MEKTAARLGIGGAVGSGCCHKRSTHHRGRRSPEKKSSVATRKDYGSRNR